MKPIMFIFLAALLTSTAFASDSNKKAQTQFYFYQTVVVKDNGLYKNCVGRVVGEDRHTFFSDVYYTYTIELTNCPHVDNPSGAVLATEDFLEENIEPVDVNR